ncbi:aldehyde dehydrogenase family protein [Anaerococcus hydrogenalis]|uniref:Aldehyde dehydrogenase n=2 Tax=Bacillati TaxID=1783272 RepID=A0A2N6UJ10_9FIRM|nr:aldehyde dehydrogenase family protein [Anaerococcus hydrogenalis]MDK7695843.1 aldehyde dehydrogenase family protein [Anaerococcus hydrogenalis]MDK7697591.1 aldehyde dehydrogenase family protein [Anaerococcus hydrogenalis]MDK7708870.1 aldehyde dehydrogenase family protein [Anaerococcus hydrogenalis]PMC81749.1 aldehyde dehydrogenase family protein [Anaerococcus hydrogenalis]
MSELKKVIDEQNIFFRTGRTNTEDFRKKALIKLKNSIKKYREDILYALKMDLNKSTTESYISEIANVYGEIDFALKNLSYWMKDTREITNIEAAPAKSFTRYEPLGITLVISPWNYPFLLAIDPIVNAISSGNTIILKTSRKAVYTSKIIKKLLDENFDRSFIYCVDNEKVSHEELLSYKYDHIFFTGSSKVGREIMEKASKNLTKVTLELGGKSPCIVDESANLKFAAKRIIWGKLLNSGQTCVAPDYLLVHKDVKDKLLRLMKEMIFEFFGDRAIDNPDYPRIIDKKALDRLVSLMEGQDIYTGGLYNSKTLKIEPTIINNVDFSNKIMKEEIFGPILPVIEYDDIFKLINKLKFMDKPLAMYIFSEDKDHIDRLTYDLSSGGVCINDTIMHLSNPNLEFGGVGESGSGGYHGKFGFMNFSNRKSIMIRSNNIDVNIKYPPYSRVQEKIIKKIFK